MSERIDGIVGAFDSFRVEEAYNWRDDIMEITRRIVQETDKARLNNIAEHFEVDLSEIRDFLEMKRQKLRPQTNADRIRAGSDNDIHHTMMWWINNGKRFEDTGKALLEWLKSPVEVDK